MPNKLPTPGQDSGNWGTILNSYLNTTLSDTGGINTCDVVYLDDTQVTITNAVITSITDSFITTPPAPAAPPIKLEIPEIPRLYSK